MKNNLIIGATSAIAAAYCQKRAKQGDGFVLVGRNLERLSQVKAELDVLGAARVTLIAYDFSSDDLLSMIDHNSPYDVCLVAHGSLPDQEKSLEDDPLYAKEIQVNLTSTLVILAQIRRLFIAQKKGTIAVITSVAKDRARKSNYFYGALKASVGFFCDGMRMELSEHNINVLEIKPGFVDTPMTQHLSLPKLLTSPPSNIADCIDSAIIKRKHKVYAPFYWWGIMLVIKLIPSFIFKKMNF